MTGGVQRCRAGFWFWVYPSVRISDLAQSRIRVTMTFRISQFAAVCGVSLLILPGVVSGQAPRYQSPFGAPAAPQPTPLPAAAAITPNATVVEDVIVRVN